MRSSFSYSSRCDRTETHSPDAIENAPATSPATPASTTMDLLDVPPATPMTSAKFETSPPLTPKTVARSSPPIPARCPPPAAGQRPIQRGTAELVGPHLAELGHFGIERGSAARHGQHGTAARRAGG